MCVFVQKCLLPARNCILFPRAQNLQFNISSKLRDSVSIGIIPYCDHRYRVVAPNMISTNEYNPHEVLASEQILADRKRFFLDLKENSRGRFFKITEDVGGRRDTIMLPIEHAQEFVNSLQRLLDIEQSLNGS